MAPALFPDNTVLCNFAVVDSLDLLERLLRGRGRWVEAVAYEAEQSAGHLPALGRAQLDAWLGEAITIERQADIESIERVRRAQFGGSRRDPTRHLGEAQTLHVLSQWEEFRGAWWISDDRESLRLARHRGIVCLDTLGLLTQGVADDEITAQEAFELIHAIDDQRPGLRLPTDVNDLR